jgi:hypothetical protein
MAEAVRDLDPTKKTYLGDGAFVELCELGVMLTTSNGYEDTNTIVLGEDELATLFWWLSTLFPTAWARARS